MIQLRNSLAGSRAARILSFVTFAIALLLPGRVAAHSCTVTDDAFLSSNSTTQKLNAGDQGISLIVAGSSATVASVPVGTTTTYIKFQLPASLPANVTAANVSKATLKLFLSPCKFRSIHSRSMEIAGFSAVFGLRCRQELADRQRLLTGLAVVSPFDLPHFPFNAAVVGLHPPS